MLSRSSFIKIIFNTVIGGVAIILWLHFVDLKNIGQILQRANFYWLIPAALCMWVSLAIRAYKLKFFLSPIANVRFSDMVALNGVALLLNFFIPIRAGEVGKGLYLVKTYSIPISKSIIWVFVDRFIDLLVLFILTPILLLFVSTTLGETFFIVSTLISITLMLTTYLIVFQNKLFVLLLHFVTHLLMFGFIKKHFQKFYLHIIDTFQILNRPVSDLAILFMLTAVAYLVDGLILYFCFLGINSNQNVLKMLLGQLLSALTFLIPAAPGYIGSLEASNLVVFTGILSIDKSISSSMSVLFHALTAVFTVFWGLVCLYLVRVDFRSALKK